VFPNLFEDRILARAYSQLRVAIFTDAAMGNLKQARALAAGVFVGLPCEEYCVQLKGLSKYFAPQFKRAAMFDVGLQPALDAPEQLDFAIGCGRAGAIALDALKRAHTSIQTLQILDPKCSPNRFDAVICPKHDRLKGANVSQTIGAIHAIDDAWLTVGQMQLHLPAAKRLVLLGAPTRHARYNLQTITAAIKALPHAGLCISTSRRTPIALIDLARNLSEHCYFGDGENPYQRWLSTAEEIYATADSVNMITEAAATQARIYLLGSEYSRGKIAAFCDSIQGRCGHAVAINDMPELFSQLRQRFLSS
jgi:uncharacterized protein